MAHRAASRVLFPSRVGAPDTEESDSTYSAQSISSNSTFSFDPTLPTVATTNTKPSLPSSHLGSSQPSFDSDAEDYCSVLTADSPADLFVLTIAMEVEMLSTSLLLLPLLLL
jgi:hypothetical protein